MVGLCLSFVCVRLILTPPFSLPALPLKGPTAAEVVAQGGAVDSRSRPLGGRTGLLCLASGYPDVSRC